jgi:hypothetical protein
MMHFKSNFGFSYNIKKVKKSNNYFINMQNAILNFFFFIKKFFYKKTYFKNAKNITKLDKFTNYDKNFFLFINKKIKILPFKKCKNDTTIIIGCRFTKINYLKFTK